MDNSWGTGMGQDMGELPSGLTLLLAQNALARDAYGRLTEQQKEEILLHMKGGMSGEEALERVLGMDDLFGVRM